MCPPLSQSLWLEEFRALIGQVCSHDPPKASNGATSIQSCVLRVREEVAPEGNSGAVTKKKTPEMGLSGPKTNFHFNT